MNGLSARTSSGRLLAGLLLLAGSTLHAQAAQPATRLAETLLDLSYVPDFEPDALFARGIDAIEKHPTNPLTEDLVARLLTLAARADASPTNWARLQGLLDDKTLHGLTRLRVRSALASRLALQNKLPEAMSMAPLSEYVRAALAIGPFGDEFGDGFGRLDAPELETPELEKAYPGRFGSPVRWRRIESRPRSVQLELAPRGLGPKSRGTHYALVQLHADETGPAWLQLTCGGSFESWWNEDPLASMHRGVDRGPTRSFTPIVLRKGWNRLLFKCASASVSSFSVRVVDDKGNAILGRGVKHETGTTVHAIAPRPEVDLAAPSAFVDGLAWLRSRLAGSKAGASVKAAVGNLLARQGFGDVGLAMAREANADAPDDVRVRVALMATWRLARHVPADLRRSALRGLMRGLDAKSAQAHAWLFTSYVDQLYADDAKEDALRAVDARLAAQPNEVATLSKRRSLLLGLRWRGAARRVLERLVTLAPQPQSYLRSLASALDADGSPKRALATVERALELRPGDTSLLQYAASLAKKTGDEALVDRYVARRWSRDAESRQARRARAESLVDRAKYREALAAFEKLRAETPEDPDLLERIAEVAYRSGDEKAAKARILECLAKNPERHSLRHFLTRLERRERFAELEPWRLDVDAAIASFEERDEDRASPTTLVLDQMVIRVYEDGSQMEETHVLRRVNDRRGVEMSESAEAAANADELLALRTITSDGRSWSPHRVAGSFTMPRLAPGVFIEERYRNMKSSNGLAPIDFASFFFRGFDRPYRFSRLVVVMPKDHELGDFVLRNFPESSRTTQELGDLRAYIFLRENAKPIQPESAMPSVDEIAPWVTFGRDASIAPALRSWRTQFDALTTPFEEIRRKANELCRGKNGDVERARAIHEFVHAHAPDATQRGGSSQPVSILLKGEGPRFWLELALLRAVDIPWTPAVIRPFAPAFDPAPNPAMRTWDRWPARGARVEPRNGKPFWLILGAPRWQPFGQMPSNFGPSPTAGCPYILLVGDVGIPGVLDGAPVSELAEFTVRANVQLRNDDAVVEADVRMPGDGGRGLKERIRTMPASQRRLVAQQLASYFFRASMSFQKAEWIDLDKRDAPFHMRFQLIRRRALRARGDQKALAPLIPPRGYTSLLGGRGARRHPFVSKRMMVDDWVIRIDPGEARFRSVPRGKLIEHGMLTWALAYERDGRALVIRRTATLRPGRIEPKDYAEFLEHCRQIDSAESQQLILQ